MCNDRAWYRMGVTISLIGLVWFAGISSRPWFVDHWWSNNEGVALRNKICATIERCSAIEVKHDYRADEGFVTIFKIKGNGGAAYAQIEGRVLEEMERQQDWMKRYAGKIIVDVSGYRVPLVQPIKNKQRVK